MPLGEKMNNEALDWTQDKTFINIEFCFAQYM